MKGITMTEKKTVFKARIWKVGTGHVITIPKNIMEALNLRTGDKITVIIKRDEK